MNARALLFGVLLLCAAGATGCPDPLQDQVSVMAHEQPLRSVPAGVVPVTEGIVGRRNVAQAEPASSMEQAAALENPFRATRLNVQMGHIGYDRYCSHCHGDLGYGWTSVGSSFDPRPPDLVTAIEGRGDGELFGHITFGAGRSPALGPTIAVDDRWRIIHFLRTLPQERERAEPSEAHWDQRILRRESVPTSE